VDIIFDTMPEHSVQQAIWQGKGSASRLPERVEQGLHNLLMVSPVTGNRLFERRGRNRQDFGHLTFSGPKSLSILWGRRRPKRLDRKLSEASRLLFSPRSAN